MTFSVNIFKSDLSGFNDLAATVEACGGCGSGGSSKSKSASGSQISASDLLSSLSTVGNGPSKSSALGRKFEA